MNLFIYQDNISFKGRKQRQGIYGSGDITNLSSSKRYVLWNNKIKFKTIKLGLTNICIVLP